MEINQLHVLLVCNLGASTGVMVTKMKEIAQNSEKLTNTDVKIEAEYNKPIQVIDTKDYGTVNGANILKDAIILKLNK
ncbi:hypothetical protein ACWLNX_000669 [Listeria monocytogenes]